MPIDIKKLIMLARRARKENTREGESTKLVTSKDLEKFQEELEQSRTLMLRHEREEIIRECMEQMQAWLEQQRLR